MLAEKYLLASTKVRILTQLVAKVVPQSCDPLASAVVGRKSAAELNSREILEEESFAAMAASETGRAQLHLLANILEDQYAPIVQKARIILAP